MAALRFASFSSDIELPFYTSLASHKINHDKLDDSARRVLGLYELKASEEAGASCRIQIHGNALTSDELVRPESESACYIPLTHVSVPAGFFRAEGTIKNVNTIEDYRALDKAALLNRAGRTVRGNSDPSDALLCLPSSADLGRHK